MVLSSFRVSEREKKKFLETLNVHGSSSEKNSIVLAASHISYKTQGGT